VVDQGVGLLMTFSGRKRSKNAMLCRVGWENEVLQDDELVWERGCR